MHAVRLGADVLYRQAADNVATPVLRTSGLLSRSNKVMYDVSTDSVFDTFTGDAVSGPLRRKGSTLEQNSVTVGNLGGLEPRPSGHHDHRRGRRPRARLLQ